MEDIKVLKTIEFKEEIKQFFERFLNLIILIDAIRIIEEICSRVAWLVSIMISGY